MTKINNKKKLLGTLTIGGLILSAPFAAFASTGTEDIDTFKQRFDGHKNQGQMTGNLLNEPDYEKQIEMLEKAIEKKIEQANSLIGELDEESVDVSELEDIVSEYMKLETFLEEVEAEKEEADYLKELFFEYKEEATDLTTEFRTLLISNLTDDEVETLRKSLRETQQNQRGIGPRFDAETLEMIDEDLAESYANGDLTIQEVMEEVKEIMDAMTDEERKALHEEMKEAGFEPRGDGSREMNHLGSKGKSMKGQRMHNLQNE